MPQFDPTWIPAQVFWLIICFGTLVFLMSKLVIPRIAVALEDRQKRIDDDLNRAEELNNKALEVRRVYDDAISKAKSESETILRTTREELAEFAARREKETEEKLAKMVREGEANVQKAKTEALGQVKEVACEVVKDAAQKLTGLTPDDSDILKAVESVMEGKA